MATLQDLYDAVDRIERAAQFCGLERNFFSDATLFPDDPWRDYCKLLEGARAAVVKENNLRDVCDIFDLPPHTPLGKETQSAYDALIAFANRVGVKRHK